MRTASTELICTRKTTLLALFIFTSLCGVQATPLNDPADAARIVEEIQRADYEGNQAAMQKGYDDLKPFLENKTIASRVRYWRGFAQWRRAINGFNDAVDPKDLEQDLQTAINEFKVAAELDPKFVDAKVGIISCVGYTAFIHKQDQTRAKELIGQFIQLLKEADEVAPDNPRLVWVHGPMLWNSPPERGGGQDKTIENHLHGLELCAKTKPSENPLDPTWGKPELMLSLAYCYLNKKENPDVNAAEKYARSALEIVPYWHYVRDILLPSILEAKAKTAGIDAFADSPIWWVLAGDVRGDGRDPSLPDAATFAYRYDKEHDFLWFRVRLYTPLNEQAFGVNIAFDTGSADSNCPASPVPSPAPSLAPSASKMNWWGSNKDFQFDRLLTAWVTRGEKGYQGTIGIGDAAGAKAKNFNNLMKDNLKIRTERDAVIIGVKRTDITDKMKMNLIAAVGSNERWNDDVPNPALKFVTLDLAAPRPARGLRDIDFSRNNLQFPPGYKLQAETECPRIEKKGKGQQPLILIPGVYSGKDAFAGFISRNESRYTFYIVTPPGLNGTPSRGLPPESTSYGDLTWTRRIERDVLDLIGKEKLIKPVLITHGFPASIVADEVALRHPDSIAGVIDIAAMPKRFAALRSPKDQSGKTPATAAERVQITNDLANYWFKYVTPETWESNNYQPEMFANDSAKAEQVRQETEKAPLEVKIHYLCEAIAVDFTDQFSANKVPLLALIPGFDEKFLTDPATSSYKGVFQDAWQNYSKYPNVELVTIPNARALILDDQPQLADDAIASFIMTTKTRG